MKPKILKKDSFLIAGIAGSGDETAKAWEAFSKINKISPLKNQVGETGYEIRLHPAEGLGKIYVGVAVKDAAVPPEYQIFFVPAATYAEFEIYPARGWESSNAAMTQWLEANAGKYREGMIVGMKYGIEVYDKRYKSDKDPASVVGFWLPVVPVEAFDPAQMILGPLNEFCGCVAEFAGPDVGKKVTQGKDEMLAAKDPVKGSLWMKDVINRLDAAAKPEQRRQIMSACGRACLAMNIKGMEESREARRKCASEEEFLNIELNATPEIARYERDGDIIYWYYTPRKLGIRCVCPLFSKLPDDVNASPTYCQCSRAFVESYWSGILGRLVKVELGKTSLTGAEDCQFIIHLR
jgi:predicted transcriptional regulator YdeE